MILIMSGTKDGRALIEQLSTIGCDIIATTTTTYGGSLIHSSKHVRVIDHALDSHQLIQLLQTEGIKVLIDATHPYATGASENAMLASQTSGVHYVRYEREELETEDGLWFDSYDEIIAYLKERKGNILLTIGANNLGVFAEALPHERLFARVLPMSKIISKCESYGLNPRNILGVQGPFSAAYNEAMMDAYNIRYMVTKATAKTGGFDQKILSAKNKGVELLILKRPTINYTAVFNHIDQVVKHTENFLKAFDRV